MAQIRSKQIRDFLSTVDWNATSNFEIANTSDIKLYVSNEITEAGDSIDLRVSNVEDGLAAEISATNSDVTKLAGDLSAEISDTNSEVIRLDSRIEAESSMRLI